MGKDLFGVALAMALGLAAAEAKGDRSHASAPAWPEITRTAKPWAYNWWMASAVDAKGLEAQCAAMREAGLGGFHVIPIYGAEGYEAQYRTMLSPEWVEAWNLAVRTARRYGLGVDLSMGSGWCFGGPWVTEADASSRGMRVKRAGPGGEGFMIDPFSPQAMTLHIAQFEATFGKNGTAERPRAFYHDSYEYYGAEPKHGGDWDAQQLATFTVWTDWCRKNGYLTRNEAHGSPVNWLDFYAIADIPETEMFGEDCRDILISKFASSAAHVTGKKLVSSESCTWIGQHFGVPLAEYKRFLDRLFLSGVNHMFYHGCCYSPAEAPWPGWCFYASSEMNPRNPIWRDAKYLNAYVARCQAMFQASVPDNDTLLYWPLEDYRKDAGGPKPMTVHKTDWFYGQPVGAVARKLCAEGCAFDYVSDRQLQTLDLSRYARLVVPPCRAMPAATRAAVDRFVSRPARLEPFAAAGLSFTRQRRGDETIYFLVNTNGHEVVTSAQPSAKGARWWMDPMTGDVKPCADEIALAPYASGFLVVKGTDDASRRTAPAEARTGRGAAHTVEIAGPWTLTPVCGGPKLPPARTMEKLSTWSRRADGGEEPFSGTMRYKTSFDLPELPTGEVTLDLGRVEQSASVRLNGAAVGFAILAPYRIAISAAAFRVGRNELEVEVTSVGQNRLRQLGKDGVRWAYFKNINMVDYRHIVDPKVCKDGFRTETLPLVDCGLFGPVRLEMSGAGSTAANLQPPARHQPLDLMGRTFWHGFDKRSRETPWVTGNPELDNHPVFTDGIVLYQAWAPPPPPESGVAVWSDFRDNFTKGDPDRWILEKCPDPTRPFFIEWRYERNRSTWGSPVRIDLEKYRAWRAQRPNLVYDGEIGEWCNDLNMVWNTLKGQRGTYEDSRPNSKQRYEALKAFMGEKPKNRYEYLALLKRYYAMRRERLFSGKMAVLDAHLNTFHIAADFGAVYLRMETTASGPYSYQTSAKFVRGASRQFGVPWEWYVANYMNGPSKRHPGEQLGDAICTYPQKAGESAEPRYGKLNGTRRIGNSGPEFGISRSIFKRTHYLAYLSGANVTWFETWNAILREWDAALGKPRFSPRGRIYADFVDFTRAHPNRGAHYSPVAICVPLAQGYPTWGGQAFADRSFAYTEGDKALDAVFYTLVPRGEYGDWIAQGEEQMLVNTPFADMYDVIVPDVESQTSDQILDVMKSYRALVVAGDYRDRSWEKALAKYEAAGGKVIRVDQALLSDGIEKGLSGCRTRYPKLETALAQLQKDYFPFEVTGSCAYGLTVAKDHVWLYVFNNEGVTKFADVPEVLDATKATDVTITPRSSLFTLRPHVTELLSGKAVSAEGGAFNWHLGPGELAIFEIKR